MRSLSPFVKQKIDRLTALSLLLVSIFFLFFSNVTFANSGALKIGSKNLCLDVHLDDYNAKRNGGKIQTWPCNNASNQTWRHDLSTLQIKTPNGMCLDIHYDHWRDGKNGGKVQFWKCYSGNANQQWVREGNQLRLASRNLCLDLHRPHYDNGNWSGHIQVWSCSGQVNQQWHWSGSAPSPLPSPTGSRITCESHNHQTRRCEVDRSITSLHVHKRLSDSACYTGGSSPSYYYEGRTIIVKKGCRAIFGYTMKNIAIDLSKYRWHGAYRNIKIYLGNLRNTYGYYDEKIAIDGIKKAAEIYTKHTKLTMTVHEGWPSSSKPGQITFFSRELKRGGRAKAIAQTVVNGNVYQCRSVYEGYNNNLWLDPTYANNNCKASGDYRVNQGWIAYAWWAFDSNLGDGGIAEGTQLALHEIGHLFGLGHWDGCGGTVMVSGAPNSPSDNCYIQYLSNWDINWLNNNIANN